MLTHEWRELEVLCEKISDLRHRYTAAQRTKNTGLILGLKGDIALARRQRELLVHHISARLGSAASAGAPAPPVFDPPEESDDFMTDAEIDDLLEEIDSDDYATTIIGFTGD